MADEESETAVDEDVGEDDEVVVGGEVEVEVGTGAAVEEVAASGARVDEAPGVEVEEDPDTGWDPTTDPVVVVPDTAVDALGAPPVGRASAPVRAVVVEAPGVESATPPPAGSVCPPNDATIHSRARSRCR
jgi:hypothetical protein